MNLGPSTAVPELTDEEIVAAFDPHGEVASVDSRIGKAMSATMTRGLLHLVLKSIISAMRNGHRGRSQGEIDAYYGFSYHRDGAAQEILAEFGKAGRQDLYRLGRKYIGQAEGRLNQRMVAAQGVKILQSLDIESLCEVGCGNGRNLFAVANGLPQVKCSGFELAQSGVDIANAIREIEIADTPYGSLYEIHSEGQLNIARTEVRQASAFDLPIEDDVFDIVITNAALEQMELGLPRALSEIRRVSRKYVLMNEPFADVNSPLQRLYLWSRNYFRMPISALRDHGLEPVHVWRNFPTKITFGYAFVLCKKV